MKHKVRLMVSASGYVEVELHHEVVAEMDRLIDQGKFREACELLEGDAYREVAMELLNDGEVEDMERVKAKRKVAP